MGDRLFDKRVDNYFRTENVVLERTDLNIYEKMVYIVLCRYANNNDGAFPSYNTIAKNASVCRDKAIKTVKTLETKKLIEKETRLKSNLKENNSNIYYVLSAKPNDDLVVNDDYLVVNNDHLVVNNDHPSSCQLPKEELYKKNNIKKNNINNNNKQKDKKNVVVVKEIDNVVTSIPQGKEVSEQAKSIVREFKDKYTSNLDAKKVQALIDLKGLEIVKEYTTNLDDYIVGEVKSISGFFIDAVKNEYEKVIGKKSEIKGKTIPRPDGRIPNYANFEQRPAEPEENYYTDLTKFLAEEDSP